MTTLVQLKAELAACINPAKAEHLPRFFKTQPGGYGEGDQFIGVVVPDQRRLAKRYAKILTLAEIATLLKEPIHEYRQTALFILVYQFAAATQR
ncbi:MAG: DNA alkylation repair protein, partial [Firmicutes bacterium]|nr:DNA alkylation repair protein [Bacillota bacterium]